MIILAIDTSCDDTSIAVLKCAGGKVKILSNVVSSQIKIHKEYGGIHPTLAKRAHLKNLPLVLKRALKGAKLPSADIDAIAITVGPGLEPCLWTGINFAESLAKKWKVPIIPVNHIEAHILANFAESKITLPAVALIVSGGHTQLALITKIGQYKIIGETRDDAAGECFDKTARILNLAYPGGPAIAKKATGANSKAPEVLAKLNIKLPRPMIYSKDYDFSFSGLKTAVLYAHRKQTSKTQKAEKYISAMASEIQQAIIDVLIKKTFKASFDFKVKSIILGGGVIANQELRKQFQAKIKKEGLAIKLFIPSPKMRTDNAAMIGVAACLSKKKITKTSKPLQANANLRIGDHGPPAQ